jgi:hypothetical protein
MRAAVLRLVTPIVWRVPGHGARKLYGFAKAEQGSRIDLLHAAHRTASGARRVLYLRHALDESRHAGMFWRRSTDLRLAAGAAPYPPPVADTERLFERLGELAFLAFVHRGERRGRRQFERYAEHFGARGDARTRTLFEAILSDEHRHERYTRDLLVELAGGERAARAELRRAALWEAWRTWRRAGRTIATVVYTLAMIAIYLVAGSIAAVTRLRRRPVRWVLPPDPAATSARGRVAPVIGTSSAAAPKVGAVAPMTGTSSAAVPKAGAVAPRTGRSSAVASKAGAVAPGTGTSSAAVARPGVATPAVAAPAEAPPARLREVP